MKRPEFFELVSEFVRDPAELQYLHIAWWFAEDQHDGQERENGECYFEHPIETALILIRVGVKDVLTIALALLHDVIEDTFAPPVAMLLLWGAKLYDGVILLSKWCSSYHAVTGELLMRSKWSNPDYYKRIREGPLPVRLVKCADRIHNLRTCEKWSSERKRRKAEETLEFIVPIADATHPVLAAELRKLAERLLREVPAPS